MSKTQHELECGVDCPDPYEDGIESVTAVLVSCIIIVMGCCLEWAIRHKHLMSHYFEYCVVFTIGAMILTTTLFLWPLNDTQATCSAKPLFLTLGFSLMFGIFVSRIRKVWTNFVWLRRQTLTQMRKSINSKRIKREPWAVFGLVVALEFFLMTLMYSVPTYRPKCTCSQFLESDDYYATCSFDASFGTILLCVNLFPIGLSAFFGYEILKEFQLNTPADLPPEPEVKTKYSRTEKVDQLRRSNNASFNTLGSTRTVNSKASLISSKSMGSTKTFRSKLRTANNLKSKSEGNGEKLVEQKTSRTARTAATYATEDTGEILGVRQEEVDEFKPIFIAVSSITFVSLLVTLISMLSNALHKDGQRRMAYYLGRSLCLMLATTIPVAILYSRAYAMVIMKQESLRSAEVASDLEDYESSAFAKKKNLTMSDRVVKAMASFRGRMPGDTVGRNWGQHQQTSSSNQTSGGSTNSFFMQFKSSIRQKLTTNNTKEVKHPDHDTRPNLAEQQSQISVNLATG